MKHNNNSTNSSRNKLLERAQVQHTVHGQLWNICELGSGPPILFLHNGGGTLWNWAYQLEHFSTDYRVIAPDLPGFGRSHRPSAPLTLQAYLRDLSALLDILDCPKPILVGNCIGASIALELALRQPDRVAALALFNVCGGLPMLTPHLRFWATLRPSTRVGTALFRYILFVAGHPDIQQLNTHFLYARGAPPLHPALRRFTTQQRFNPALRASLYWLVMGLDSFSVFSQPRQRPVSFPPALLSWGAENRTLAAEWSSTIAEWLQPEQVWLIENAGHMPMYEQPAFVNAMLNDFLKQTEARRGLIAQPAEKIGPHDR